METLFCGGKFGRKLSTGFGKWRKKKNVAQQDVSKRMTSGAFQERGLASGALRQWEKWVSVSRSTNEMRRAQPQTSEKSHTGPNHVKRHGREA